jgi:hypothetical protein
MDFQHRFAIFTAVGIASFSAGLSLTTACSQRADVEPETIAARPALPTTTKPAPAPENAQKPSELALEVKPRAAASAAELRAKTDPKTSAPSTALAPDRVAVRRLVVTHAVSEREPIEPAELVSGTPIVAFVELSNEDGVERSVVVTFERAGRPAVGHVKLNVPAKSPRYRSWARTHNLTETGVWEAVVRAEDGTELGRQPFDLLATLDPA